MAIRIRHVAAFTSGSPAAGLGVLVHPAETAATAGLVALVGGVTVPVVLLVLAGAAWVWRRGWAARVHAPAAPPATGGAVSTADLCATWRHTARLLRDLPPTSPDRPVIVDARRRLLDEFERRDPVGFRCWMQGEPEASGDPARYLGTDR